jgi:drug efflux transport system ATP-binding protein
MYSVEINNISRSYQEILALKEINFSVKQNEIFGLIGPDGAGKTSLFRILTTLLLPNTGSALMEGFDIVKDYRQIRNIVGYMPGRFSLYQDLSVEENLSFFASVFGTTIEENYDLIKDIYKHIEPFKKRRAGALSGGMKQKLALSCALIHRPKVLILDEPTTGVDAVSRKEFWDLLHKIRQEGITILVSTPYMDEAERCDRVALIQNGEIMSIDSPSEISMRFTKNIYSVVGEGINYQITQKLRMAEYCHSAWLFGQTVHVSINDPSMEGQLKKDLAMISKDIKMTKIEAGIEDTFIDLMQSKQ